MRNTKWLAWVGAATLLLGVTPSVRANDEAYKELLQQNVEQRIQLRKEAVRMQSETLLRGDSIGASRSRVRTGTVNEIEPNDSMSDVVGLIADSVGASASATSSSGGAAGGDIRVEVIGTIDPKGDVDYYAAVLAAGDFIKVDVDSQREGAPIDPIVHIFGPFDPNAPASCGKEIATRDDGNGLAGSSLDPCTFLKIATSGKYFIEVDDLNDKRGGADQTYRMTLTIFANEEQPLTFAPAVRLATLGPQDCGTALSGLIADGIGATANATSSSGGGGDLCSPVSADAVGTLAVPGEKDCYALTLVGPQTVNAHVVGKQCANFVLGPPALGQAIDPVLTLLDPANAVVASNDDTDDIDSAVFYTVPATCTAAAPCVYNLCVSDHFGTGTPNHQYELDVLRQCNSEIEPNDTCATAQPYVCHPGV